MSGEIVLLSTYAPEASPIKYLGNTYENGRPMGSAEPQRSSGISSSARTRQTNIIKRNPNIMSRRPPFATLTTWCTAFSRARRPSPPVSPLKGDQTTAIVISVLHRPPEADAIPVAWRIHLATQRGSWADPTVELLKELAPAVPKEMTVIVLCDRGISSPKLWTQIREQGWHPSMRYRKNITFCADGGKRLPASAFVSVPDTAWIGRGTAFGPPTAKRRCTLLVVWYAGQKEPWIILTDLAPDQVGPSWYALRFWIELGFKAIKSLGWQWGQDPPYRSDACLPPLASAVGDHPAGLGLRLQSPPRT